MSSQLCLYIRPHPASSGADQLAALATWADSHGHQIVAVFTEPERKRGADRRRESTRMLSEATIGRFDRVAAVSLISMCRSVQHADAVFTQCAAAGVAVSILAEGIDTATDSGRTAAAFALAGQLDHDLHTERAVVGNRKRAAAGFPLGRRRVLPTVEARITSLLKAGVSPERIMRMVGCGKSTIYRVRRELDAAEQAAS